MIKTEWDRQIYFTDDASSYTDYFKVETIRGEAFNVTPDLSDFDNLMQLFNQMTLHLPYTWEKYRYGLGASAYKQATRHQGGISESSSAMPTGEGPESRLLLRRTLADNVLLGEPGRTIMMKW